MGAPGFLLLLIFSYIPMFGIIIAFKDYRAVQGILGSAWVGFKNFEFLVRTPALSRITFNTLFLNTLFITTGLIGAVILALLLNEVRLKLATRVYQTVIFFPFILSWVIVGYFSFALLNFETGLVNAIYARRGRRADCLVQLAGLLADDSNGNQSVERGGLRQRHLSGRHARH